MSTTVEINSSGWTLTTFYGGALGRAYTLTIPNGGRKTATEEELLNFFGSLPDRLMSDEMLSVDYALTEKPKKRDIRWHTPVRSAGGRYSDPLWPEGWPVPNVGDSVYVAAGESTLWVRAVDYFPGGEESGDDPFIYVVLTERPMR